MLTGDESPQRHVRPPRTLAQNLNQAFASPDESAAELCLSIKRVLVLHVSAGQAARRDATRPLALSVLGDTVES